MTAYAYLRRSAVSSNSPGDASREAQEAAVKALARRHGERVRILEDWGISGRKGADKRPGYKQLLVAIESGRCTAVYSYSLSRLGRSLAELARLIKLCSERGIPVRLHADSLDTSTASGLMLAHILGAVAQFEADVAAERTRAAVAARVASGGKASTVPYFGDRDGEDAQAVLDAFHEAGSYSGGARLLNQRGVACRTSKRGWWPSAVSVIVNRIEPQPMVRRGARAAGTDFILAGLMRCPTCGTRLTGLRDRGYRDQGWRVRYSCRMGSVRPHQRMSVSEHLILGAVKDEVARLRTPERVETMAADAATRKALDAKRTRVVEAFVDGDIDRAEKDRRLADLASQMEALDARREIIEVPTIDWTWKPGSINRVLRTILDDIELDPEEFQPLQDGFAWRVPEWRSSH